MNEEEVTLIKVGLGFKYGNVRAGQHLNVISLRLTDYLDVS